jgi:predicted nucleic acid-binding protein
VTACLDASVVLKLLVYESGTDRALEWLTSREGEELVAPSLLLAEVASVLQRRVQTGELTPTERADAMDALESLEVRVVWDFDLIRRAAALADELDQATVYDTIYLAVAEREQCALLTADHKFAKAAATKYPLVRLL